MAGVVPKKPTSGRKQWTLHGGPKSSLKRLRSQLASDGCPESQVVLAKQLLDEECESDAERRENARLGVYWLMKASEQGNIEATELLKTCLQTGKGITEHNYMDVKSCISMTQDEKLARKAAREMFASLSNGGEYITSDQLQRKILAIDRGETCSKSTETSDFDGDRTGNGELVNDFEELSEFSEEETDWSQKSDCSNEKLTEDHIVSAAVDYSHGQLPLVNQILCLSDPNLKALDHIPFVYRSVLHPLLALKILYYKLVRFLGQKTLPFLYPLVKSELHIVVLMAAYVFFSSDNVLYFLPMLVYYTSFFVMVCATFQMLQNQREFIDFRLWSGLFLCYSGGSLNAEETEHQYIRNNMKPYGQFFLSFLINLLVYPVISEQWIPQSELTIVTFLLTFTTLLGFMPKHRSKTVFDPLVLFSFAVNVLAKYPYETDPVVTQGWRFLELKIPTFPSYVIGNGIEFCISFRFVLYASIPLIFLRVAYRQRWRGTYKMLIPHCVTLAWLQICIISSQGATMFGLLRGTLALVGVVLFLPLVGITSVILPVVAVTKWIITSNLIYTVCVFVILSTLGMGICYVCAQTRYKKYTAIIQIVLMVLAFLVLINSSARDQVDGYFEEAKSPQELSWNVFQRFCHQPVWQEENFAVSQIKCADLDGSRVHWSGYISDIKVMSISNTYKRLFDRFPSRLSRNLYCLFGEETESDCERVPDIVKEDCMTFFDAIRSVSRCSLRKYNKYTFEIVLKMDTGIWGKATEASLVAPDSLKNFVLKLRPTDEIWFKGTLFNNEIIGADGILGGSKPHIDLEELGCVSCQDSSLREIKLSSSVGIDVRTILNTLYASCKFLLNVFLNPLVVFK
ncbi:wolframin ER transmembrane glycoprotein wfs1 [Leptinotarsa decemlineata]|uniref:wolframin ER transmembrane glycoprotein wfs1 n=1 Tax=Leptinotarsa decemlineata TaxID=7539 RepID=UPI003D307BB7